MDVNPDELVRVLFSTNTVFIWLFIVIVSVILSFKQKIVVFRDYNDLALVFLLSVSPLVLGYLLAYLGAPQEYGTYGLIGLVLVLLLWVSLRTFQDNHNPFYFILALITKISLSFLFLISLLSFITPGGKTTQERMGARRVAFVILMIVTPLLLALVRERVGIINLEKMASRRGLVT